MACIKNKDGECCQKCPPGKYVVECSTTRQTKCDDCKPGTYTAFPNNLSNCLRCKPCLSSLNLRTVSNCTAERDIVCECETGYFCSNDACDHCQPLTECHLGEGVKVKATKKSDTICAKCEEGTYSNVTDYSSPCIAHTRCEDIGREVETPGSLTTDAVCGNFKARCSWMLPAGLWAGLVFTILIVAVFFLFWRARRKSHRAVKTRVPGSPVDITPTPAITLPDFCSHCQESDAIDSCKLNLFNTDNLIEDYSSKDSVSKPPLTVYVSSLEYNHNNGSGGYSKGNFFRLHSEPQEDEWCGGE